MILITHPTVPEKVFATHSNAQLDDVLDAYSAEHGVLKVVETRPVGDDLPAEFELIRAMVDPVP